MKKESFFQHTLDETSTLQDALETLGSVQIQNILFGITMTEEAEQDKDVLIQKALDLIPLEAQRFAWCLDTERYNLVQSFLKQDGVVIATKLSAKKVLAFLEAGMAYPATLGEKRVLVMPKEIRQALETIDKDAWKETAGENTRILNRANGLLLYYGYLDSQTLLRFCLLREPKDQLDMIYFMELLFGAVSYYGVIASEENGFRHRKFWNFAQVLKEQEKLDILEYKTISTAVLELAGRTKAVEWTVEMERLRQFLMCEGNLTKNGARHVIEAAWFELNNGMSFSDTCEYIWEMHFYAENSNLYEALCFYVLQMFNSMPQWMLKGRSFHEMGWTGSEEC